MVSEAQEWLARRIAGIGVWHQQDVLKRMEKRDPFVNEIVAVFRSVVRSGISGHPEPYLMARLAAEHAQKPFGTTFWAFMRGNANERAAALRDGYQASLLSAAVLPLPAEREADLLQDLDRYLHTRILQCLGIDEQAYAAECELFRMERGGAGVLVDVQSVAVGDRRYDVEFVGVQDEEGHWTGEARVRHDMRYSHMRFSYVRIAPDGARTPLLLPSQDVIASWHVDRCVEVRDGYDVEVIVAHQPVARWHFELGRFSMREARLSVGP